MVVNDADELGVHDLSNAGCHGGSGTRFIVLCSHGDTKTLKWGANPWTTRAESSGRTTLGFTLVTLVCWTHGEKAPWTHEKGVSAVRP